MRQVTRLLLEICAASVDDCRAAVAAGADRLELNAALFLGGLTPSLGMLQEVKRTCDVPVVVMIRPRGGGFHYSSADLAVMERDLDLAIEHGADGVAWGVLTSHGEVEEMVCRRLLTRVRGREAVFHRAFDFTPDRDLALETLIELGFARVMTSGGQPTALAGADAIARHVKRAAGRIEILPAGGIDRATAPELVSRTGCDQVHASLRTTRDDGSAPKRPTIPLGGREPLPEGRFETTDSEAVAALREVLGSS
jgi:copper homeostasis protein